MTLRHLRLILWIGLYLLLIELALEWRAVRRGWEAMLLGVEAGEATSYDERFGPRDGFPFRSLVIPRQADEGVSRFWLASSSYGEDLQLEPQQLFAHLLGERLSEHGIPNQVLNASRSGYWIPSNLRELRAEGPRWRPDAVILYQMSNDIDKISTAVLAPGGGGESDPEIGGGGGDPSQEPDAISRLVEQTTIFKHIKSQLTARLSRARLLVDELGEEGDQRFERLVWEFVTTVRELDAQPVLCTFATSHLRSSLDELPLEYELNLLRFNMHLSVEGWVNTVARFNRVLRRVAEEAGVPLVDLARVVGGQSQHFRDYLHLTASGHQIVAGAIADVLGPKVQVLQVEDRTGSDEVGAGH